MDNAKLAASSDSKMRAAGELLFSLLLLVGSFVLAHQAWAIAGFSSLSSAGVFPMLATGTMVVSALVIAFETARKTPVSKRNFAQAFLTDIFAPRIVVFASLIFGYMLILQPLGFAAASFLFLLASMIFLRRRRIVMALILSSVSVVIVYLLFRHVFGIVLPRGIFL